MISLRVWIVLKPLNTEGSAIHLFLHKLTFYFKNDIVYYVIETSSLRSVSSIIYFLYTMFVSQQGNGGVYKYNWATLYCLSLLGSYSKATEIMFFNFTQLATQKVGLLLTLFQFLYWTYWTRYILYEKKVWISC